MTQFKSILITGASSGIGAALAEEFAAPGVTLFLGGRSIERLSGVSEACRKRGATVEATAVDSGPAPDVAAARHERDDRLRHAVLGLREDLRFPVTAHYWSEVPVSELAEILNLTPQAVRKRLYRAHEALAAAMNALEAPR